MSLKTAIVSRVMAALTSDKRQARLHARAERRRRNAGAAHVLGYFHQVDDPYSHLAAQALLALRERYDIEIHAHLVGPPADWAAPERARLVEYARIDAARLARRTGLSYTDAGHQPAPARLATATATLAARLEHEDFLETAVRVGGALWNEQAPSAAAAVTPTPAATTRAADAIRAGAARRQGLGHFMSAMVHYGDEWYWGVDRLHYLEARLAALGARRPGAPPRPFYEPHRPSALPATQAPEPGAAVLPRQAPAPATLHYYLSFRSPYTYLATERVKALADAYGLDLQLRFVLPMVMRGLPVPRMKAMYFALDTAREARSLGIPFGRIADPLGEPVARGYSLLPWARDQGKGYEYCLAFLRAVWSQGVDAGSDAGLARIVAAAGLSWTDARQRVGNDDWRAEAETNRAEMLSLGLWGVPCFRVDTVAAWGQDRLWVIEDHLAQQTPG
jgi:2-hydroxychromene-2-carboxylate isomerase